MKKSDFDAWEKRIKDRAEKLWIEAGRPEGPRTGFEEEAREQIAIQENPTSGTRDPDAAPVIEEASIQENLGEFPSAGDRQAEDPAFPDPDVEKPSA